MLKYDRIDVSHEIDIHKTNESWRCIICNYYSFKVNFKFQSKASNGCNDLIQKATKVLMMLQLILLKVMIIKFIFGT